jgi:hypothetical protein
MVLFSPLGFHIAGRRFLLRDGQKLLDSHLQVLLILNSLAS